MKFFRPIYLLFAFFAFLLITFDPEHLRRAPRPGYEELIKFGIIFVLCIFSGFLAFKTFLRDVNYVRGRTEIQKNFEIKFNSVTPLVLTPVSGQGPCQVRLEIKRIAKGACRDEFELSRINQNGQKTEVELASFTFNKATYEFDVVQENSWTFGIEFRALNTLAEPFVGKAKLKILGRCKNISIPESFLT